VKDRVSGRVEVREGAGGGSVVWVDETLGEGGD